MLQSDIKDYDIANHNLLISYLYDKKNDKSYIYINEYIGIIFAIFSTISVAYFMKTLI